MFTDHDFTFSNLLKDGEIGRWIRLRSTEKIMDYCGSKRYYMNVTGNHQIKLYFIKPMVHPVKNSIYMLL